MSKELSNALNDPEVRRVYEEELLFGEAHDTLAGLLVSIGISQRELAERVGVSEGRISQVVTGKENLTLRSLASFGWALGVRFQLNVEPMTKSERQATPAGNDPLPPSWLSGLTVHESRVVFQDLEMPGPGSLRADQLRRRPLEDLMAA